MKLRFSCVCLLLTLAGCVMPAPPGFTVVESEASRVEAYGYSVQAPGKGWFQGKNDYGVIFGKRNPPVESYHAGITVTRMPNLTDRKAFNDFARKKLGAGSDSFRYKVVRTEVREEEKNGLWLVAGRLDFEDAGAVNAGPNPYLLTCTATLFVLDPQDPERLVALWYSWRGTKLDEAAFDAAAARFFDSLQKSKTTTPLPH